MEQVFNSVEHYNDYDKFETFYNSLEPYVREILLQNTTWISSQFFEFQWSLAANQSYFIYEHTDFKLCKRNFAHIDIINRRRKRTFKIFHEDIFKEAVEPKELMTIPNAVHVDLYDKIDIIAFDKLESFFETNLKQVSIINQL